MDKKLNEILDPQEINKHIVQYKLLQHNKTHNIPYNWPALLAVNNA